MSTSDASKNLGMSTLADPATQAWHRDGKVFIRFASGQEVSFPVEGNPRLEHASDSELNSIELSPLGIHWPTLDEDLSFEGILVGRYGQTPKRPNG